jgi:hypothetical protein
LRWISRRVCEDIKFVLSIPQCRRFHLSFSDSGVEFEGIRDATASKYLLMIFRTFIPVLKDLYITINLNHQDCILASYQHRIQDPISGISKIISTTPYHGERTIIIRTQLRSRELATDPGFNHYMRLCGNPASITGYQNLFYYKTWGGIVALSAGTKMANFARPLDLAASRWASTYCEHRPRMLLISEEESNYSGWGEVSNYYSRAIFRYAAVSERIRHRKKN